MCTVSVIPTETGYRLLCNRDERDSRPQALAPRRARTGAVDAMFPIDPLSGGTWLATNDAAMTLALLNRTPDGDAAPAHLDHTGQHSRGTIIPRLIARRTLDAAIDEAAALKFRSFQPFWLMAVQGTRIGIVGWTGSHVSIASMTLTRPHLLTSSSLGDAVVNSPRRELFEQLVRHEDSWLEGQMRFHAHVWPDRQDISVVMARPGARTVSRSGINVHGQRFDFTYEPLPDLRPVPC